MTTSRLVNGQLSAAPSRLLSLVPAQRYPSITTRLTARPPVAPRSEGAGLVAYLECAVASIAAVVRSRKASRV